MKTNVMSHYTIIIFYRQINYAGKAVFLAIIFGL